MMANRGNSLLVSASLSVAWSIQAGAPLVVPVLLFGVVGLSLGFFTTGE